MVEQGEMRRWMARWAAVEKREIEVLRAMTVEEKVALLADLMSAARHFDVHPDERADGVVRERWIRLRERSGRG